MTTTPQRLMVEHLVDPVGTSSAEPRLSWWLPEGSSRQEAYRIETGRWDSGRIESGNHLLVPYAGPTPLARERVEWRVRSWTDLGESGWSAWSHWEVGLPGPSDWSALWIAPRE